MRKFQYSFSFVALVLLILLSSSSWLKAQSTYYVMQGAGGAHSGANWATAYADLQAAIDGAQSGDMIFVAAGTYQPATSSAFTLKEGVKIYGGFSGVEQSLSERVLSTANVSILQGNGSRVVDAENLTAATLLDGFTITGGHSDRDGGGIYNSSSAAGYAHLLIKGNLADNGGGGILNLSSTSVFTHVILDNNTAQQYGGGMANVSADVSLLDVFFVNNNCAQSNGGGMGNFDCSPKVTNGVFYHNTAFSSGGGVFNNNGGTVLVNCSFFDNDAESAGPAIANFAAAVIQVTNSVFYGNTLQNVIQPGIYNDAAGSVYSYCYVAASQIGTLNIISTDDPFIDAASPAGADGLWGTQDDGLGLAAEVAAINNGNNSPNTALSDITGAARIYNAFIDMGAYEYYPALPPAGSVAYVDASAAGGDGSTWLLAFKDLEAALTAARSSAAIKQIWVAKGTYQTGIGQSFSMVEGVKMYGGFLGTETFLSDRDLSAHHLSILKGNNSRIFLNNANHLTQAAVLDGFTLTSGVVAGTNSSGYGGAMQNFQSSPVLSNLVFTANSAERGGAIYNSDCSPSLIRVSFDHNAATGSGGAVYNNNGSNPQFMSVNFVSNTALNGGAVYNENSSPQLINTTFYANTATGGSGGALYNLNAASKPVVTNSLFWANSGTAQGADVFNNNGLPVINFCYTQTSISGDGMMLGSVDPVINGLDPIGPDGFWNTADDGLRLKVGTLAIDGGNSDAVLSGMGRELDITGGKRILNKFVDMGAYEYLFGRPGASGIVYVNGANAVSGDGSSWTAALTSFSDALATARVVPTVKQIWVANGTYIAREGRELSMVEGVKIYGGFVGTETTIGIRSLARAATTILKGNNSRVFNNSHISASSVLDGFTLSEGKAYYSPGAGMNNEYSSPTLSNLVISHNSTPNSSGGGMSNDHSSPSMTNIVFDANSCSQGGAGLTNESASSPILMNVVFINNFTGEALEARGGGIGNYDGALPIIINADFVANKGGAIHNGVTAEPTVTNTIFYGNMSDFSGKHTDIHNDPPIPVGATAIVNNSYTSVVSGEEGVTGVNNIVRSSDPFVDLAHPAGLDGIWGTQDDGLHLKEDALVIDKGDNSVLSAVLDPLLVKGDVTSVKRISNQLVDMGAYEYQAATLPVQLASFTAEAAGYRAKLAWTTATEINNKAFIIYRSSDGKTYQPIGRLTGKGNSSVPQDYVFYDEQPLQGVNIYRLEQLDNNGHSQSLGVRSVTMAQSTSAVVNVYPNPVKNDVTVSFMAGQFEQMELLDISGKVLRQRSVSTTDREVKLDMQELAAGIYFVRLSGKGKLETRKLLKR